MQGRIQANGINISYRFDGLADGPTVTLSNSLASNLSMWEPQMPALTRRFRVLRYDQRGHGASDVPNGPYTFEALADDVRGLWRALGVTRSHFVGLSLGGMVAQALAVAGEPVLDRIVIADSMSEVTQAYRAVCDERIRLARTQGMEAHVAPTIARWFTAPFVARNPAVLDRVRDMIRTTPVEGFALCCELLKRLDYTAELARIDRPSLIIVGEHDPTTTVAASRLMYENIRGSKLVILPSASHISNIEQPEPFNRAMMAFLEA